MTNSELETFMDLFDTALASDTPAVKKALRNLMLVSSIDTSPDIHRPLRDILSSYESKFEIMSQEIKLLHSKIASIQQYGTSHIGGSNITSGGIFTVGNSNAGTIGTSGYVSTVGVVR